MLAGLAARTALSAKKRIERTRLSAIGDEVAPTVPEQIGFLKYYGLNTVEIRELRLRPDGPSRGFAYAPPEDWKETRSRLDDAGIRVIFLNSSMGKIVLPGTEERFARPLDPNSALGKLSPEERRTEFERQFNLLLGDHLKRCMDAGDAFGCRWIRVFAFRRVKDPIAEMPRIAEVMDRLAESARAGGFTLLLENEGSTNVATTAEMAAAARLIRSKNVALCWDPQNALGMEAHAYPAGYRLLPRKRIWNVQLKADGLVGEPAKRLDWGAIMHGMNEDGYRGQFTLETHKGRGPDNFRYAHLSMREMLRLIGEPLPSESGGI
jgi:hypothetical protein